MKITRLRNKLLLSAVAISLLVATASMLAVSWVIKRQYLGQSQALLGKATNIINDHLLDRQQDILAASRQLATQKNLGSTLWYLSQYAQADIERDTLLLTYRHLAEDTRKIGQAAKVSRILIYDASGGLVSFALFDDGLTRVGFVGHHPAPVFQLAALREGEELNRKNLREAHAVAGIGFDFGARLPQRENVRYAIIDGVLSIESHVPITGGAFDPATGNPVIKQLGLVSMVQPLNQHFVEHLSQVTDTKINIYGRPDAASVPAQAAAAAPAPASAQFGETTLDGADYYRSLIPLHSGEQWVGSIDVLHSKEIVRNNIREMMQILGQIAAVSLLLIFLLAWYFATSISGPLSVLSRIFRNVANSKQAGTLTAELGLLEKEKRRQDELGDLTQSFIAMNTAINQKICQIKEINASLEQKIEERTAALAARERESRTLIENSPDTIARYDRDCRRLYVNPAFGALSEGGAAALLGTKPSEYPGGEYAKTYEAKIGEVFAGGGEAQFELQWAGKDGREICSHIRLTPERDAGGHIVSVLGVGRDITELNEYRSELKRKSLAQARFLAAAGHDLRQPIHAQGLFLDVLSHTELSRRQRKLLDHVCAAGNATAEMINTLLDYSRIEAGAIAPHVCAFHLQPMLNKIEREFWPQAEARGLAYRSRETALAVKSDPALIEMILRNLVSNAIRYTAQGGVLVACRQRGGRVLLEVWDSGIGIAPEHRQEVFQEFRQLGNPERDRRKGLGLGLAIADGLARTLGHPLAMDSRVGRGSVFRLSLPLARETPVEAQPHEHKTQTLHARALIIEDDEAVRDAMFQLLREWGCQCERAESIAEALALARAQAPDVVISDYRLREQHTGLQAIIALRELLGWRLPALLITGDTAPERLHEAQQHDIALLHKPVAPGALYRGLVKVLKADKLK